MGTGYLKGAYDFHVLGIAGISGVVEHVDSPIGFPEVILLKIPLDCPMFCAMFLHKKIEVPPFMRSENGGKTDGRNSRLLKLR